MAAINKGFRPANSPTSKMIISGTEKCSIVISIIQKAVNDPSTTHLLLMPALLFQNQKHFWESGCCMVANAHMLLARLPNKMMRNGYSGDSHPSPKWSFHPLRAGSITGEDRMRCVEKTQWLPSGSIIRKKTAPPLQMRANVAGIIIENLAAAAARGRLLGAEFGAHQKTCHTQHATVEMRNQGQETDVALCKSERVLWVRRERATCMCNTFLAVLPPATAALNW